MAARPKQELPYRRCVGVMVLNSSGKVWVGRRLKEANTEPSGAPMLWQMPQGGLDKGEDAWQGALRELHEETGIRTVSLIEEAPDWIIYDLPEHLIGIGLKGKYRGQKQRWFAVRFEGAEDEIAINPPPDGHDPEFDAWRWVDMADLPDMIVAFKRDAYRQVVEAFAHLARPATEDLHE